MCGSGGACGNWGNLAPLRPPPEWEKMPTHSGAGHDGRARAGAKLHFPAASFTPSLARERKGLPAAGRPSASCRAPSIISGAFAHWLLCAGGGGKEPPPPRPIGRSARQSEGGAAGLRLGGRRGGQLIRGSGSR